MLNGDFAFSFSLGLVAAFNPCGFAMLPVYVSFFMGTNSDDETNTLRAILRAIKVGAILTLGFVAVFGSFGLITATILKQGAILEYTPYVTFVLGILFVPLGIAMLMGYEPKLALPRMDKGGESGELASMFLFGVSYAVVSLGCTAPIFINNVTNSFTQTSFTARFALFIAYAFGMGAVILALTLAAALARNSVATNMRKILPWMNKISGGLLGLSGAYLAVYGWWEIQVLRGNISDNRLVRFFEDLQGEVNTWIDVTGPSRLGVGLLIIVGAVLLKALWSSLSQPNRIIGATTLGGVWVIAEFAWQKADLLILPIIRTILQIPERFGNWFTDPFRWGVLGELLVIAMISWTLWFRFGRSNGDTSGADSSPADMATARNS